MEHKECFALKSELGMLKFLVSEISYIKKLKPFKSHNKLEKIKRSKSYQLVSGNKKTSLLKKDVDNVNGYLLITPIGSGFSYFVDGDLDPVFRKEIVIDERSLAEAIIASPESVRKYVPASKITHIKNEATYSLYNQSSNNPNLLANLDIIEEFVNKSSEDDGSPAVVAN